MDIPSMALGGLIGTIWWIFFIWRIFIPKVRELESKYESEKEEIIDIFEDKLEEKLEGIDDKLMEKGDDFLDKALDPENEKVRAKIATLGVTLLNPLLIALQDPDDVEGRKIMENLLANAWKTVEESTWFKQSFKQWIRQNSNFVIKAVVEEASKNPELIQDVIRAYVDVQKEQKGGAGRGAIKKKVEEEGIWGLIDLARDSGMF